MTWLRFASLDVLTARIVEAFVSNQQVIQDTSVDHRFFENARYVAELDSAVEDCLRINRDARSMLALLKATGRIGSHERSQAPCFDLGFECVPQRIRTFGIATATRMAGSTLIATDKDVMRERGHDDVF